MAAIALFKWIVCSTVMATFLVFIVLIIKLIFKNKLGARWHYIIWTLVLLKLLIPFGPQSQFSVFNLLNMTDSSITEKSYTVMDKINTATTSIARSTPIPRFNSSVNKEVPSGSHKEDNTLSLSILGLLIWFSGASFTGIHIIKRNIKLYQELKIGNFIEDTEFLDYFAECKKLIGIKKNIAIKSVLNLKTPALFGILNPVLLIPADMLNECSMEQIKYAVYHELAHLKRKDIPMNFLLSVLLVVHWFNPLIWYAFYKMRQDTELACDEFVLSHLEPFEQKKYGLALIHLVEKFSSNLKLLNAVAFLGNRSLVKKRIEMIASYKKKSFRLSAITIFIFTLLVLAAFTNAVESLNINNGVNAAKENSSNYIIIDTNTLKNIDINYIKIGVNTEPTTRS